MSGRGTGSCQRVGTKSIQDQNQSKVKIKIKTKVKGSGQECPLYTTTLGVRGGHFSKSARSGAPDIGTRHRHPPQASSEIQRAAVERSCSLGGTPGAAGLAAIIGTVVSDALVLDSLMVGSLREYFNRQYRARTPSFHPIFLPSS